MGDFTPVDALAINTIRTLAMDAVQKANSGHPGAPMGLAPVAYVLWNRVLSYDPADPTWPNRDRFVLSNGHASMLLYSLIHLAGVKHLDRAGNVLNEPSLPLEQLQQFRQLGSRTPGHPECDHTAGVETTTGPLGQGIANAVGMAIAQKWIASYFGRPGFDGLFAHRIYAICGDGCMMEGISSEAASLAGHLALGNLTLIYDDNTITIDGHTDLAFSEDVGARFIAYGWNVLHVDDGNDLKAMAAALEQAKATTDRPTLIVQKTVIGYGAPHKQNTHSAHGEALGEDEIKLAKKFYGWPEDKSFFVPDGVYDRFQQGIGQRGRESRTQWTALYADYRKKHPDLAAQFDTMQSRSLPAGWDQDVPAFKTDAKGLASRDSSGQVLNATAKRVPWIVGGSADLNPSTKTFLKFENAGVFTAKGAGRNIHFGVREHAMGGIINGMALSKLRSYGAGFLIFSDYGRGALRLGAVMHIPVLYVFTHDSIGVGEDGPTHQPVEHLASMRAMPGLCVIRPCDANEVVEAYRVALQMKHEPVVLSLTRQAIPTLDRTKYGAASGLAKGGYVLADSAGPPELLLIATGSEIALCVDAYEKLTAEGAKVRVVSLPSWDLFEKQTASYRDSVIPSNVSARVCVEAGSTFGWERYAGPTGAIIGMRSFGASAPIKDLMKHFGFTAENVLKVAREQLAGRGTHPTAGGPGGSDDRGTTLQAK